MSGGNVTTATLTQIEKKFMTLLNEYVDSSSSSRHPLMIYNNDSNTSSGGSDEASSTYFDRFTSKWMSRLPSSSGNLIVVYRYCNHTVLAAEVLTLMQTIVHQLCYILDVHESLAFESPWRVCENLCKSLVYYFAKPENKNKQIVIILNSLDRCLKSAYDVSLVVGFMSRLFGDASNTWPSSAVRVILTLSANSSMSAQTAKLVNSLHKKLDTLFVGSSSSKPTYKLNIESQSSSRRSSLAAATSAFTGSSWSSLNDQLTGLLFGSGSGSDSKCSYLVDLLVYFLNETRYGVKQAELNDLFRASSSLSGSGVSVDASSSSVQANQSSQNIIQEAALRGFMLDMAWHTLKYFGRLFATSSSSSSNSVPTSLLALCTDQSQVLFKLAVANLNSAYQIRRSNSKTSKFDEVIYAYYNR